ncbi:MAG: hypothetical protein QW456_05140 [Ignisphaera sp.]
MLTGIILVFVALAYSGDIDIEKVVEEYCHSPEALKRFTPLTVGRELKIYFTFDGMKLDARIDNLYSEVVATVELGKVIIKNTELWDLFEWYCAKEYATEYMQRISIYSSAALSGSILLAVAGSMLFLAEKRKK